MRNKSKRLEIVSPLQTLSRKINFDSFISELISQHIKSRVANRQSLVAALAAPLQAGELRGQAGYKKKRAAGDLMIKYLSKNGWASVLFTQAGLDKSDERTTWERRGHGGEQTKFRRPGFRTFGISL